MQNTETIDKKYLKPAAAAEYCCISASYLAKLRHYGNSPKYIKIAKKSVAYDICDLDEWLESKKV